MPTNKNWAPLTQLALRAFRTFRQAKLLFIAVCTIFFLAGCQPPGPKSLLLGQKYLEEGNYEKALKYLTRASELMKGHPQVWNHLGLAYHGLKNPVKAVESYQYAIRIDRNLPAPHYNLGVLLLEEGHYPQAISELNAFVTLQTNSPAGWTKLGTALVRAKRADEADRALNIALRLEPKNAEAHNNLGLAHIQRKRPRDAMLAFNNALHDNPTYAPAVLNQAITAQQHFGNKQLALERYKAYLTTRPDAQTTALVQETISNLEKEIAGIAVATKPTEGDPFTAFLRKSEPAKVATNTISATNVATRTAPATNAVATKTSHTTNTAHRIAATAINSPSTNVTVAAAIQTNTAPKKQLVEAKPATPVTPTPAPATNAVATTTPPKTEVPPATATTTVASTVKTPEPKTETKTDPEPEPEPAVEVEVVAVEKEPDFKPIADLSAVKIASAPVTQAAQPTATAPQSYEDRPLILPRKQRKPEEEKPGILSRVNPVRWFKDDPKKVEDEKKNTQTSVAPPPDPKPLIIARNDEPPPRQTYRPPAKPVDPKPEPPRVLARYQYRRNIPLAAGNRKAAEKVFQQGVDAHQSGKYDVAMEAYQNASTLDPSYYEAHYNLGLAAYQAKNLPLALAASELALAAKPSSKDARYNFALTLREANYPADAAQELNKLLEAHPEEVRAHFALANLYAQQLDQPALARKHYLAVLELNPNHSDAGQIRQWLALNQKN